MDNIELFENLVKDYNNLFGRPYLEVLYSDKAFPEEPKQLSNGVFYPVLQPKNKPTDVGYYIYWYDRHIFFPPQGTLPKEGRYSPAWLVEVMKAHISNYQKL